ncbi:MAG: hypothetical protein U1F51_00070 [Burkholderiales bacterium]
MPSELLARVSKSWFSNYDDALSLEVRCGGCDRWTPVSVRWHETRPGTGDVELPVDARARPFVLTRHVDGACACGAGYRLVLTGAAGGRHGEEQYGVAALESGGRRFV